MSTTCGSLDSALNRLSFCFANDPGVVCLDLLAINKNKTTFSSLLALQKSTELELTDPWYQHLTAGITRGVHLNMQAGGYLNCRSFSTRGGGQSTYPAGIPLNVIEDVLYSMHLFPCALTYFEPLLNLVTNAWKIRQNVVLALRIRHVLYIIYYI